MTREISPNPLKDNSTINNTKFLDTVMNTAMDVVNIKSKSEGKSDKNTA
jgi:hypothetical protein